MRAYRHDWRLGMAGEVLRVAYPFYFLYLTTRYLMSKIGRQQRPIFFKRAGLSFIHLPEQLPTALQALLVLPIACDVHHAP